MTPIQVAADPPGVETWGLHFIAVTVNGTAWSTIKGILENLVAHIVMVQEHKLLDDEAIAEAQQWCLKHNWVCLFGQAAKGPKGKPAGGTAVFGQAGL